jgi:hypothetical protein
VKICNLHFLQLRTETNWEISRKGSERGQRDIIGDKT